MRISIPHRYERPDSRHEESLLKVITFAIRLLALLILISPPTVSTAQRRGSKRAATNVATTGEQQASRFWSQYIASCGGSHYARKAPGVFVEFRGFRIQVDYQPVSDADRLNGVQAKGISRFSASAHRHYSRSSWHEWDEGIPQDMQLTNSVRFQKRNGQWSFSGVGYFNDFAKTVTCSDVPGFRNPKMRETATNAVQITDHHNFPIKSFIFWDTNTNIVGDRFPQSTTTFINWKITYSGTAFSYTLPPVESRWFKEGAEWSYASSANFDNVSEGHLWHGKGWADAGHWEIGSYTVKVYLRKQLIAEKSFEIVRDDALPGNVRFDGLYYQRFQDGSYWFFRFFENGMVRDLGGPLRNSFEALLKDAWGCTNDFMLRYYNFDSYCKEFNMGQGSFTLAGNQITFSTQSKFHRREGRIDFNGTVLSSGLKLQWNSSALNVAGTDSFTYTRCPYRDCVNTQ
jgi:hypothetical protein